MDIRKNIISNMILKTILYIVLFVGFIVSFITINNGVYISKEMISSNNYLFEKVVLVIFIIITFIGLIHTYYQNFKVLKKLDENSNAKVNTFNKIELVISVILLIFSIYLLTIFPLAYDSLNNNSFGLNFAVIILLLTNIIVTFYNLKLKDNNKKITIDVIAEGSVLAALAVVLSLASDLIPGLKLPNGGSFSLSMLPIYIYALRRGFIPGLIMGGLYGMINFLVDGLIIHWGSIFFDYLLPFSLLGAITGVFNKKAQNGQIVSTIIAVLLGGTVRYVFHGLSGVIFFSEYAGEYNAWFYSFVIYNLPYMLVSTIGSLIFTLLLQKRFITLDSRIR